MSKHSSFIALLFLALVAASCLPQLFARDEAPANWTAIERACAAANLELAKTRLAMAQDQKQAVADSVSQETIDALEANVQYAQNRLAHLTGSATSDPFVAHIAAAENQLKALEADHAKSLEANQLAAGAVPELQLRNEVAEINVAKARLAAVQALGKQPADVRVQWQINELQQEIRALWARPLIED